MCLLGVSGLVFGVLSDSVSHQYIKVVEANQGVITMLIAVGFLKLLFSAEQLQNKVTPTGRKALLFTLINTHLFGSVLNMSSIIIVGDRLAARSSFSPIQAVLLLRAFCTCAFWSPFFATMGLVLMSAPGAEFSTLVMYGIPISLVALAISAWEINKHPDAQTLSGYPLSFETLWVPCFLALVVIILHVYFPHLSVLTLVSVTALLFTLIALVTTQGHKGFSKFVEHIETGVANSSGEVVLFSSAALLATGVVVALASLNLQLAPNAFGLMEASVTLFVLVLLAVTGMHPVTTVVLAGSILAPSVSDPNLLGLTLLMSWSLGIILSPVSGVQLSIQSRYQIRALVLLKLNLRYAISMYMACVAVLWAYIEINFLQCFKISMLNLLSKNVC